MTTRTVWSASYFDGRTAASREVRLQLMGSGLQVEMPDGTKAWWGYDQALVRVDTEEGLFGWGTAVGLAADLQLAASKPDATYVDGNLVEPFRLDDDGMPPIPDHPGRGIELDMDAVKARGGSRRVGRMNLSNRTTTRTNVGAIHELPLPPTIPQEKR